MIDKEINIDEKQFKGVLNYYNDIKRKVNECYDFYNFDMVLLVQCIDTAITMCEFDDIQMDKLNMWFNGCKEYEIAEQYGVSTVAMHYFLVRACKRIAKQLEEVVNNEFRESET